MDPLSVTASVIAVLQITGTVLGYLNAIKDAAKDRARCALELSSVYGLLTTLRCRLETSDPNEAWCTAVRALAVENGPLDQFTAALERLSSQIAPKHGFKKVGEVLLWKISKAEVESVLSSIVRLEQIIQIALEMDHFKLSQAIKDDTAELRSSINKLDADFQDMMLTKEDECTSAWLSPHNFKFTQSELRDRRQANTGKWFLGSAEFSSWLADPKSTLFCPGIPGAGKTMIASIAVDELTKTYQKDTIGLAYVYCNYNLYIEQSAPDLVGALLKQLIQRKGSVPSAFRILFKTQQKENRRPSCEDLLPCFRSVLSSYSHVYLVVDALDECRNDDQTRSRLLSLLREWQAEFDVRILLTSRHIPDIVNSLGPHTTLEIRAAEADLQKCLDGQMWKLPRFVSGNIAMQTEIKTRIIQIVDGMFQLAQLHFDSLTDKLRPKALEAALDVLPRGPAALKQAYDSVLKRIDNQQEGHRTLAKETLSWIVCARRQLKTDELLHALAVDPTDTDFDERNIPDLDDVLGVCAGLIRVNHKSGTVEVVHYTVQEYLQDMLENWMPFAREMVGRTCITYLTSDSLCKSYRELIHVYSERLYGYKLLRYALQFWGLHYRDASDSLRDIALRFLQNNKLVACAGQILVSRFHIRRSKQTPKGTTGAHLAAYFGLEDLLQELSLRGIPVDSANASANTPLSLAVERGHESVVKYLIERGDVDPNRLDSLTGATPFLLAAKMGHVEILKLLSECSQVDIHLRDFMGRTALASAALYGHLPALKLLLTLDETRAVSTDKYGMTPLMLAAQSGREEIINSLLERDNVTANESDNDGRTALFWAVFMAKEGATRILLAHKDISADSADSNRETPLYYAASSGKASIVQLLIDHDGVDINSNRWDGSTALDAAAERGHTAIVEMLKMKGAISGRSSDRGLLLATWDKHFDGE